MKKVLFLTALAGLVTFTACQKPDSLNPNNEGAAAQHVTLIHNIGEKAGYETAGQNTPGTRAIKNAWENGDNLYLFFQPNGVAHTEDVIVVTLTYDGTSWEVTEGQDNLDTVSQSGRYIMAYVSGSKRTISLNGDGKLSFGVLTKSGNDYLNSYGEIQYTKDDDEAPAYTFDSGTKTITLDATKLYAKTFQIVITNLNLDSPHSTIRLELMNNFGDVFFSSLDELSVGISGTLTFHQKIGTNGLIGQANADGVAFYGVENVTEVYDFDVYIPCTNTTFFKYVDSPKAPEVGKAYKMEGPILNEAYDNIVTGNGWEKF